MASALLQRLAALQVLSGQITLAAGLVGTTQLAASSVTNAKLAGLITSDKISSVSGSAVGDASLDGSKLAANISIITTGSLTASGGIGITTPTSGKVRGPFEKSDGTAGSSGGAALATAEGIATTSA